MSFSSDLTEAQRIYIRDVLGVTSIVQPKSTTLNSTDININKLSQTTSEVDKAWLHHPGSASLAVLQVSNMREGSDTTWSALKRELLDKILCALKLELQAVEQWEWIGSQEPQEGMPFLDPAKTWVLFGERAREFFNKQIQVDILEFGEFKVIGGIKVLATHSLTEMLENPNLKKVVWHHLKMIHGAGLK